MVVIDASAPDEATIYHQQVDVLVYDKRLMAVSQNQDGSQYTEKLSFFQTEIHLNVSPIDHVINVAGRGPQGVRGQKGDSGDSFVRLASGNVLAFRGVRLTVQGVRYASSANIEDVRKLVGISVSSALDGQSVTVQQSGLVHNDGWNWIPDQSLYLGIDGEITTNITGVFTQRIGYAVTDKDVFIQLGRAVLRS